MKIIFDYNRTIFNPEIGELYPKVLEMLSFLSKGHELFLVSRNDPNREYVLSELGISDFFTKKVFVGNKTTEIFKNLIGESNDVLVVGDRVKGEIYIGNILGYKTVWVKQGKFANDFPDNNEETPDHTINEIIELLEIVKKYE